MDDETPPTANQGRGLAKMLGTISLCVVSSVTASWLFLASGVIKLNTAQTITDNRDRIVSQEGETIAEVFKKVSPSSVAITTEAQASSSQVFGASAVQKGAGSGIIVSKDGYVLTNKHVVPAGTSKVSIVLASGKQYDNVTVIGRDPSNDIAFLKINDATDLPAALLGDSSKVEPGQKVVAIGNALGQFRNSVTAGIISGLGRPIEAQDEAGASEKLEDLFQTDAAINPGNSGGPLVDLKGEVIGMNTAISQQGQAIGFAIPINNAKGLIKTVTEKGKIIKPYLGVRYISLDAEIAKQFGVEVSRGAYVLGSQGENAVVSNSPADKAGIHEKDIITKVNNQDIDDSTTLASLLAPYAPGDKITLTVLRAGKQLHIVVTLETFPMT